MRDGYELREPGNWAQNTWLRNAKSLYARRIYDPGKRY